MRITCGAHSAFEAIELVTLYSQSLSRLFIYYTKHGFSMLDVMRDCNKGSGFVVCPGYQGISGIEGTMYETACMYRKSMCPKDLHLVRVKHLNLAKLVIRQRMKLHEATSQSFI